MSSPAARHAALFCGGSLLAFSSAFAHAGDIDGTTEVVVVGQRPTPAVPTTTVSVASDDIARTVNVITPEDTLRYAPNILIRQRHIGDTQSPVTTRTSGVGASARSLIYVDGILLSALIGNNNTVASPKWGLIAPDAVARVDVFYGPFSAAYPGNSLGSVIAFTTRMPSRLEGSVTVQGASQSFKRYKDDDTYGTARVAASVGDRKGGVAWRLNLNHLDNHAQPLSYITGPTTATGAVDTLSRTGMPLKILGSSGIEHQVQDNLSGRITYDLTPGLTAAYTVGLFGNHDDATVNTYVRDGAGVPAYTAGFSNGVYRLDEVQLGQGFSVSSHFGGPFEYSLVLSDFRYLKSHQFTPSGVLPTAFLSGPGTGNWLDGTGWTTFDAKAMWHPDGHMVAFGAHADAFRLKNPKYSLADWTSGGHGAPTASNSGRTETRALWVEDVIHPGLRTQLTAGIRFEHWRARDGANMSSTPALDVHQPELSRDAVSPKLVLQFAPTRDWTLKASIGAATRFPTVTELYQVVTTGPILSVPNPDLKPERAVSAELSAERQWNDGSLRLSLFNERVANALLSQLGPLGVNYVQNIDRTVVNGVELVGERHDFLIKGLAVSGWVTWADSRIDRDAVLPAAVGKNIPQLPRLRGALVATYKPTPAWDFSLAVRASDPAFGTIDNSDINHNTWMGFSGYTVADLHVRYIVTAHWSAELGVDNLNNADYTLFHPFPQRTVIAALKYTY